MSNNREEKEAFVANYWGQEVLYQTRQGHTLAPFLDGRKVDHESIRWKETYLLLKPLSSISDEDAMEIFKTVSPLTFASGAGRWKWSTNDIEGYKTLVNSRSYHKIEFDLEHHDITPIGGEFFKTHQAIDRARRLGFALPWNGLSVQDQLERGWIKLEEG